MAYVLSILEISCGTSQKCVKLRFIFGTLLRKRKAIRLKSVFLQGIA